MAGKRIHRRLQIEELEPRIAPTTFSIAPNPASMAPLNLVLVSDAVAQAQQVRAAAANDTIAIIYNSHDMTTTGLVDLLASVSAAHNGDRIGHLGIVAHGGPGEVDLGKGDDLDLATMPSQAPALERLRSLFTIDARLDLYSCSVAAGAGGKTFVDELSAVTGAAVFASDNPVGTIPGSDFTWEYHTGQAAASNELLSVQEMETIPRLSLAVWNHQAAVNYANNWVYTYNTARYPNDAPNDCANFVSQCLIAGGLDLSAAADDPSGSGTIVNCGDLNSYLKNSPVVTQYTTLSSKTAEPSWFMQGDVAIFRNSSGTFEHAVIAVTGDASHYTTDAGHQQPNGIYKIATFFSANPTWTQCTYYDLVDATQPASTHFTAGDTLKSNTVVIMRTGPCFGANAVTSVPAGSQVTVLSDPNNGIAYNGYYWWKVQFGTYQDWCAGDDTAGNWWFTKSATASPTVTGVSSTMSNGSYSSGKLIPITITFNENVTVSTSGGTPILSLSDGGTAKYVSGSGTSTLTFNYTVAAGQNSADLDYASTNALSLNGGTIRDAAGNIASPTLASPGTAGSLGASKKILIDTIAPTVTVKSLTTANTKPTLTGTVTDAGPSSGIKYLTVLVYGQTLTATVTGTTWTVTVPKALPVGTYNVIATAIDGAGNLASDGTTNELRVT